MSVLAWSVLAWNVFLGVSSRGKTFYECPLVDFLSMSLRSRSVLAWNILAWSVFLGVSSRGKTFYGCPF